MRKSKIPTTRRQMIALEKELYTMSHRATDDERRLRLAFAATCSPRRARASFTGFAGCAERSHNMGRARKLHRNHMINDLALAIP